MKKQIILTEEEYSELLKYKEHYDKNEIKFVTGIERTLCYIGSETLGGFIEKSYKYINKKDLNKEIVLSYENKIKEIRESYRTHIYYLNYTIEYLKEIRCEKIKCHFRKNKE